MGSGTAWTPDRTRTAFPLVLMVISLVFSFFTGFEPTKAADSQYAGGRLNRALVHLDEVPSILQVELPPLGILPGPGSMGCLPPRGRKVLYP